MTQDRFYTPTELRSKMLACIGSACPSVIADFAVGSGELLKAASRKWPTAKLVAMDIDVAAVRKLRREQSSWIVSQGDFLKMHQRRRSAASQWASKGVDLVLLNPPFSSRGSSRSEIRIGDMSVWCSRAVAFVISALLCLSAHGELVAIIPAGSLRSQKDHKAWHLIRTQFDVQVMTSNEYKVFDGCFPRTVIIRIHRKAKRPGNVKPPTVTRGVPITVPVVLYRGRLQMHAVRNGSPKIDLPLVHTKCLQGGRVSLSIFHASNAPFSLQGPAVLVPRVGEPKISKIVFYRGHKTFALSDCVIALKADVEHLTKVYDRLTGQWENFKELYRGTGAKYVTVGEVSDFLRSQGFAPHSPPDDSGWQIKRAIEAKPQIIDKDLLKAWRVIWNGKEN